MLKKRIIPVLLWDGVQCVQTVQFMRPYRNVGSLMQQIEVMDRRGVDEIIILDITSPENPRFDQLKEFTSRLFCPVTYGGGIKTIEHIRQALLSGADKVAICGAALEHSKFIENAVHKFGAQAIVGVVNYKFTDDVSRVCDARGDIIRGSSLSAHSYAQELEETGCGEILLNDVYRNGTKIGYDVCTLSELIEAKVRIPIIVNGGCGHPSHMEDAFLHGADAVAASSMFLFTDHTPKACAKYLHEQGVRVRL